jgi:hypothetical protein
MLPARRETVAPAVSVPIPDTENAIGGVKMLEKTLEDLRQYLTEGEQPSNEAEALAALALVYSVCGYAVSQGAENAAD